MGLIPFIEPPACNYAVAQWSWSNKIYDPQKHLFLDQRGINFTLPPTLLDAFGSPGHRSYRYSRALYRIAKYFSQTNQEPVWLSEPDTLQRDKVIG